MLLSLLGQRERAEAICILRILAYAFYKTPPLSIDEQIFIDKVFQYTALDEFDKKEIYSIDMRDKWDIESLMESTLSIASQKLLFIFTKLLTLAFKKDTTVPTFIENDILPNLHIGKDTQKKLNAIVVDYFDQVQKVYDFIYHTSSDGKVLEDAKKVPSYLKLFIVDYVKLSEISILEKTSFLKVLVYLMKEDDLIDEMESSLIINLEKTLQSGLSNYIHIENDLSITEFDNISTPWLKHFMIYIYLHSKKVSLKKCEHKRMNALLPLINVDANNISKNIFNVMDKYNSSIITIADISNANIIESGVGVDSALVYMGAISTAIDVVTDFMPGIGALKRGKGVVQALAKVGGGVLDDRKSNLMEFGLLDLEYCESSHIIICIDGFMTELGKEQFVDWKNALKNLGVAGWIQGLRWPSYNSKYLASDFGKEGISGLIGASWYQSLENAAGAGKRLAYELQSILKYKPDTKFTLLGHSLGARVIFHCLINLSECNTVVKEAYFLGGAVSRTNKSGWAKALQSVEHTVFNFYSANDMILTRAYQLAQGGDKPIGLGEIEYLKNIDFKLCDIHNIDVTSIVDGHTEYKDKLERLLRISDYSFGLIKS